MKNERVTTFFDLPTEIRNVIYELVLVRRKGCGKVLMCEDWRVGDDIDWRLGSLPPLLRVNMQIRTETLPIFFGQNMFFLEYPSWRDPDIWCITLEWLEAVGSNVNLIKHMRAAMLCEKCSRRPLIETMIEEKIQHPDIFEGSPALWCNSCKKGEDCELTSVWDIITPQISGEVSEEDLCGIVAGFV